ncbi:DUF190 domain-containing protein [bacterium 3DAC]|jgi:hypothetical protein|nr:DUF190 domain-containing protein [Dictyoglomota bacterium]UZN23490.1 DUF190 domain-containing protein [bacterium 3DAC]
MKIVEEDVLLRIFIGDSDRCKKCNRYKGKHMYEAIVLKAKEMGLAGATVLRGIMGFGGASRVHTVSVLRLSEDMPVVIEIVDKMEKIKPLLEWLDEVMVEGLITMEKVMVYRYTKG